MRFSRHMTGDKPRSLALSPAHSASIIEKILFLEGLRAIPACHCVLLSTDECILYLEQGRTNARVLLPWPYPRRRTLPLQNREACIEALAEWANLRCRALLPADGMSDPRRTQAIIDPHPPAWQALIASQSLEPTSFAKLSAISAAATVAAENAPPTLEGALFAGGSVRPTSVPHIDEVNRARLKLVAVRDAVVVPRRSPLPEDDVERDPSGRLTSWDGRKPLPLWSIYSHNQCPLTEVRWILSVRRSHAPTRDKIPIIASVCSLLIEAHK